MSPGRGREAAGLAVGAALAGARAREAVDVEVVATAAFFAGAGTFFSGTEAGAVAFVRAGALATGTLDTVARVGWAAGTFEELATGAWIRLATPLAAVFLGIAVVVTGLAFGAGGEAGGEEMMMISDPSSTISSSSLSVSEASAAASSTSSRSYISCRPSMSGVAGS